MKWSELYLKRYHSNNYDTLKNCQVNLHVKCTENVVGIVINNACILDVFNYHVFLLCMIDRLFSCNGVANDSGIVSTWTTYSHGLYFYIFKLGRKFRLILRLSISSGRSHRNDGNALLYLYTT